MNIQYFGTCRIFDPLKIIADKQKIMMLPGFWGFSHTTKEIIQNISMCQGTLEPPAHFRSLFNMHHLVHPRFNGDTNLDVCLTDADVVFVEISSLKTYKIEEFYTQVNRLEEVFDTDEIKRNCSFEFEIKCKSGDEHKFTVFHEQLSLDELTSDIHQIISLLGKKTIILLNTFIMNDKNVSNFTSRIAIRDILAKFQNKYDHVWHYDPSELLNEYPLGIKDYAHYLDGFKLILAAEFERLLSSASTKDDNSRAA